MTKLLTVALVLSLLLNVALAVGFAQYRNFVGSKVTESWIAATEAEHHQLRGILADLETGDPNALGSLEDRLRKQIEMGEKNLAMVRQMAE